MPDENEPAEPANGGPPEKAGGKIFVVGIGASAGGLEAIGELIRHLPVEGMAYIVVQHLAPDHESLLTQLLARDSRLQVVTAVDGMTLEANHVYVIPPNADLAVLHGVIRIMKPPTVKGRGPHLPVDYLFRSLAEDQGHAAIGIVLSGTGTDGTLGLKAIKASGGFTFVQEPSTAKYDGMPRSAMASGAADYCLPLKEIALELARIGKRPLVRPRAHGSEAAPVVQDQLGKLFVLIRAEFGNDLTQYKHATIDRRIERRMMFHKLERLEDYVRYVQQNRDELRALYKDILITVTSFFRDPETFEVLKTKVFPQLLEQKAPNQPIRVWVPACATGEEAYSIAICLLEYCEEKMRDERVQIFGTDVDDDAIQQARRGVYPANIALDVSPERLHRFFVPRNNEYQITRRIRDLLVFSRQNLLRDAPFSHVDLVSCRNLLIYLQPSAQKKVLRTLHYALNPTGHLLLGTSETVGDAPELFSPIDRKHKIYVKKLVARQVALELGFGAPAVLEPVREPAPARPTLNLQGLADRKALELYGPPGVVVGENFDILLFRGHTGPYLDPAPGAASFNLLKVARFELHIELKRALQQARSEQRRVTTDISYQEDGKPCLVRVDVLPLQDPDTRTRCFLVLFHRMPPPPLPAVSPEQAVTGEAARPLVQRNQELERELAVTKEYLQSTIEEKESTLEQLKSANEELQSSNEELQSTNEELETSKEEMQSTNEELTTVNEELHNRMLELSQANDDLHNVLAGVDNVVVIVGMDLRIRRYTSAAEKLLNLIPGDIGRSIGYLDAFVGTGALAPKVSTVIHDLSTLEEELLASNQRWYALRVSPYKTLDHAIRGALVTLVDIDVRKRAMDMTRDVGAYAARFLGAINHPLLIVDRRLRVVWANDALLSTLQVTSEETVGSALASLGTRSFADPGLLERLDGVFASASLLRGHELRLRAPDGREHGVRVGASLIPASTEVPLALLSIEPAGPASAGAGS
ncbi:MAG: chemotaxis protein CheR [Kofleriaceae bacterium]|nr:MAG: chemotaxis protein CheR [Kofleriaceae bacterium]